MSVETTVPCKAGQRTRARSDSGHIAEFVQGCTCGQHVRTATGWMRRGTAPGAVPTRQVGGKTSTTDLATEVAGEMAKHKGVAALVNEHTGAVHAFMLPQPYWTEKQAK